METYILIYIASIAVAFWAGIHYAQIKFMFRISKEPDKFIDMLTQIKKINEAEDDGMPEDFIEVRVEQVNGMTYAYEKTTGQFLAQAQNLHQAMVEASHRFPGKKFWHPDLKEDSQTA